MPAAKEGSRRYCKRFRMRQVQDIDIGPGTRGDGRDNWRERQELDKRHVAALDKRGTCQIGFLPVTGRKRGGASSRHERNQGRKCKRRTRCPVGDQQQAKRGALECASHVMAAHGCILHSTKQGENVKKKLRNVLLVIVKVFCILTLCHSNSSSSSALHWFS